MTHEESRAKAVDQIDIGARSRSGFTGLRTRAESESEIAELLEFCETGRIYGVERWIASGRPLQQNTHSWYRPRTPLWVAIESNQYDLARLLLCSGYRLDLESSSTLEKVLESRAWDYLELLLAWGADPTAVDPDWVLDTYEKGLMERFAGLGLDFTEDNCLARYLAETTSNKPAYGWARRHREDPRIALQLALALGEAVWEDRVKAVCLLLWAGADPHRRAPNLRWGSGVEDDPDDDRTSAIELAVLLGRKGLIPHLRPDPKIDEFEELYAHVCDPETLDLLFDIAERYGVSDVLIAKWCKQMNVPRPGRGYWARKRAGRRVKREPLPPSREGQQEHVHRPTTVPKSEVVVPSEIPELDRFPNPIRVPEAPDREHRLVAKARRALRVAEPDECGVLRPREPETLDVQVTSGSVGRALRIMNALITALDGAGFEVEVSETTRTRDQASSVARSRRQPRRSLRVRWAYRPVSRLCLRYALIFLALPRTPSTPLLRKTSCSNALFLSAQSSPSKPAIFSCSLKRRAIHPVWISTPPSP